MTLDTRSTFNGTPGINAGHIRVIGIGPKDHDYSRREPLPKTRHCVSANPLSKCSQCAAPKGRLNLYLVSGSGPKAVRLCRSCLRPPVQSGPVPQAPAETTKEKREPHTAPERTAQQRPTRAERKAANKAAYALVVAARLAARAVATASVD